MCLRPIEEIPFLDIHGTGIFKLEGIHGYLPAVPGPGEGATVAIISQPQDEWHALTVRISMSARLKGIIDGYGCPREILALRLPHKPVQHFAQVRVPPCEAANA